MAGILDDPNSMMTSDALVALCGPYRGKAEVPRRAQSWAQTGTAIQLPRVGYRLLARAFARHRSGRLCGEAAGFHCRDTTQLSKTVLKLPDWYEKFSPAGQK